MPRAMLNPLRLLLVLDTKHKKPALARDSLAVSSPADAKRLQASGARPSAPAAVERGAVDDRGGAEGEGGDRCWEMEASVGRASLTPTEAARRLLEVLGDGEVE